MLSGVCSRECLIAFVAQLSAQWFILSMTRLGVSRGCLDFVSLVMPSDLSWCESTSQMQRSVLISK